MEETNTTYVVTGSSGRLGAGLVEFYRKRMPAEKVLGIDLFFGTAGTTTHLASELDAMDISGDDEIVIFHAGALHKPQVASHTREEFIKWNVSFTQRLLDKWARLKVFVFTSTTSVFGEAFKTGFVWVDESTSPNPKNIYGWSKTAGEGLVQLAANQNPHIKFAVLRACRFFPEGDDKDTLSSDSLKMEEENVKLLHCLNGRRLTLRDVISAHHAAMTAQYERNFLVTNLGNSVKIETEDIADLTTGKSRQVLLKRYPLLDQVLVAKGWVLPGSIDRVYDSKHCQKVLRWTPQDGPEEIMEMILKGETVPY
jgi:nucleoside-diphosphate-sugar epimerase